MSVRRLAALVLTALLVLAALPLVASAEDTGSVSGKLVNRSPQGGSVAAQTVELIAHDGEQQTGSWTTTSAANGAFSFGDLPTTGQSYFVAASYKGAVYYSEAIDLSAQPKLENVEIAVYDTTEDPKDISISRSHVIVDFDASNQYLVVLEALVVSNAGDLAYVGSEENAAGQKETLRLPLPAGAMHVRLGDGFAEDAVSVNDEVVVDTLAIAPGSRQLVLNYFMPYQRPDAVVKWTLGYPTAQTSVVIKDVGQQVAFDGFKQEETLDIAGKKYVHLTAENLEAGAELSLTMSNIPETLPQPTLSTADPAAAASPETPGFLVAAVGLGIAGVTVGVAYPVLRRRRQGPAELGQAEAGDGEWDRLVSEIADLDDRLEAGTILPEEHERLRDEKKRRLREIKRRAGRA